MSSEKLHDATSADGDVCPYPEISQRPRASFLKRLKSFCRYSKCSETHEYESHPSDYQEEPSVLLPEQIRANQLVTYFNNNLEKFYNNFNRKHNVSTCESVVESVCPMSVDGQGGYHFSCQFRDGEHWDIYYFEEPVSNDLSVILEESMEGENKVLNRTTSQPAIEETSDQNNEAHGSEVKETISSPAALKELSNACANESNYESNIIEELVEHYLIPNSNDPDEESSASSIYSLEVDGGLKSMMSKSNPAAAKLTPPAASIIQESPTLHIPQESCDNTPVHSIEPLSGFQKTCFEKLLIHRHLKAVTGLECIPKITGWEFLDRETDGIVGADGWIAEETRHGSQVKIINSKNLCDTDKISILVKDKWILLKGRKKQRFLDDLARIQIAYSTITSPNLGPVQLTYANNTQDGIFPNFDLRNGRYSLTADIIPTVEFPKTYFLRLRHKATPFLKQLVSNFPTPQPGPYPLQPPSPIWPLLHVNPNTGNIIRLSHCHRTKSVPWEIAACAPLQLSSSAQRRWIYSLRRHWWGAHIRDRTKKFASRPILDKMVFTNNLVGLECLLRLREDSSKEEIEVLERKMMKVVGKGKALKMKRELGCIPDCVI